MSICVAATHVNNKKRRIRIILHLRTSLAYNDQNAGRTETSDRSRRNWQEGWSQPRQAVVAQAAERQRQKGGGGSMGQEKGEIEEGKGRVKSVLLMLPGPQDSEQEGG